MVDGSPLLVVGQQDVGQFLDRGTELLTWKVDPRLRVRGVENNGAVVAFSRQYAS